MKRNFCLELKKNQIIEFIESVDKKYDKVVFKSLNLNNEAAVETTCIDDKNKTKNYLFTDTRAWYGNAPMSYSKKFLTPKWVEYLEEIFGEEYNQTLSEKTKLETIKENTELNV